MAEHSDGNTLSPLAENRGQKTKSRTTQAKVRRDAGARPTATADPLLETWSRPHRPVAMASPGSRIAADSNQRRGEGGKGSRAAPGPLHIVGELQADVVQTEMASHHRRLIEEHSKLQAEYARVRMLLQEACAKFPPIVPSSPTPTEGVDEGRRMRMAPDGTSGDSPVPAMESEKGSLEDDVETLESYREQFRREVLRLKEELLATQQQLSIAVDEKNDCVDDLSEMRTVRDELEQQLVSRDLLIEQLSKQVQQLNEIVKERTVKLHQTLEEGEELQSVFVQRLKEVEQEARETKEFMQEENNSLAETLREVEEKASSYAIECEKLHYALDTKDKHCQVLSQVVEQTQTQLQLLQSELNDTQDGARELLLKQGSEINSCSIAIRHLHQLVETISERILHDAELSGIDVSPTTGKSLRSRRSLEGRRLVQTILEAARLGDSAKGELTEDETPEDDSVNNDAEMLERSDNKEISSLEAGRHCLSTQMKEVESGLLKLGQIHCTVYQYLFSSLNDAENVRLGLEGELHGEQKRSEELQIEVQDNCKQRWSLEEKNKELCKELGHTKDKLRDAHESLKGLWDKIDERASWLIENKKLKQEMASLKKQNCARDEQNALLLNELKETIGQLNAATTQQGPSEQTENCADHIEKQLILKKEILQLQQQLVAKEEDLEEKKQTYERRQRVTCENLRKAELEVQKLDASIEHILQVLNAAPDLNAHPILKQLWMDLDGQSFTQEPRDTEQDIVDISRPGCGVDIPL